MVFFCPHFLFHYNPHFCYPPFHPVFLCLLLWSYCSLGFVFTQKPKSIRNNMGPQRQPHRDGSIHIFSSVCSGCLQELQQNRNLWLSLLCMSLLWPHRLYCQTQLNSPSRRASLLCHGRASILVHVHWSILAPRDPGLPEQAQLFHSKTLGHYAILLLMKLLCLFYCLGESVNVSECPLIVFVFVY